MRNTPGSKMHHILVPALLLILITFMAVPSQIVAQETPTVPFNLDRNKIIVPTSVNGSRLLRLILDTGMGFDGVYLFHKELLNLIDTTGAIEVRVPGAGSGEPSTATMIENGQIDFGDVSVTGQRIIVSHSAHTQGFPTDGVIGWNFFGHYIVEIDYDRQLILLHNTTYAPSDSNWVSIPAEMKKTLPFFEVTAEVIPHEVSQMHVYIDLASSEALELLVHNDQKFTMPDSLVQSNLGTGLSGDINGQYGRSERIQIGGYDLHDIRTAFAPANVRSKQEGADGILGNDLIRRFNIIFDYPHSRLLIRPNKTFNLPFE
jgi:hypothetical protein